MEIDKLVQEINHLQNEKKEWKKILENKESIVNAMTKGTSPIKKSGAETARKEPSDKKPPVSPDALAQYLHKGVKPIEEDYKVVHVMQVDKTGGTPKRPSSKEKSLITNNNSFFPSAKKEAVLKERVPETFTQSIDGKKAMNLPGGVVEANSTYFNNFTVYSKNNKIAPSRENSSSKKLIYPDKTADNSVELLKPYVTEFVETGTGNESWSNTTMASKNAGKSSSPINVKVENSADRESVNNTHALTDRPSGDKEPRVSTKGYPQGLRKKLFEVPRSVYIFFNISEFTFWIKHFK
mgnify:CR=1 FL=1